MLPDDPTFAAHLQELRRGTVVAACLTLLRGAEYGYALTQRLEQVGISVEANTLYPLLRRLESQGLLESVWNTDEARPRKFYRTTEYGDQVGRALRQDWSRVDVTLKSLSESDPQ